jgi:hypothetical protein
MVETTHQLVPAPADSLHAEVLGGAGRAKYGDQLIKRAGQQLAQEFGRGLEAKTLRLTADEKTEVVANCDHLQNLKFSKAFPLRLPSTEPPKLPIGFLTHEDKKTPKASTLTRGRNAP